MTEVNTRWSMLALGQTLATVMTKEGELEYKQSQFVQGMNGLLESEAGKIALASHALGIKVNILTGTNRIVNGLGLIAFIAAIATMSSGGGASSIAFRSFIAGSLALSYGAQGVVSFIKGNAEATLSILNAITGIYKGFNQQGQEVLQSMSEANNAVAKCSYDEAVAAFRSMLRG